MRVKIIINALELDKASDVTDPFKVRYAQTQSQVWEGELDIKDDTTYVTKISILGHGEPQPICEVPFSPHNGYYMWVPPLQGDDDDEEMVEETPAESGIGDTDSFIYEPLTDGETHL